MKGNFFSNISPRSKFMIAIGLSIMPIAVVMFAFFFTTYLPIQSTNDQIMQTTSRITLPLHALQEQVYKVTLSTHAGRIKPSSIDKEQYLELIRIADKQFAALSGTFSDLPDYENRRANAQSHWQNAKTAAKMLATTQNSSYVTPQQLESELDQTREALASINQQLLQHITLHSENIANLKQQGLYIAGTGLAMTLLSAIISILLLSRKHEELEEKAYIDGLTGVPNRRALDQRLAKEIQRAKKAQGALFSLILFDVDRFKKINDTHGHQVGDDVLCSIVNCAQNQMRNNDFIARYGGEEFAIILPNTSQEHALLLAERIRNNISKTGLEINDGNVVIKTTISLGIAAYPGDAITAKELMTLADNALYRAKQKGRNRTILASGDNIKAITTNKTPVAI